MEKGLVKWFIKEMTENDVIFEGNLSDIQNVYDIDFNLGIHGRINNMLFELYQNSLKLDSNNPSLFDNIVYNKNINYHFTDKIIYNELYDTVSKYRALILKEKNIKQLDQFDFDEENNKYNLIIKTNHEINDVNFEYVGKSRIDNQELYKYKRKLPKFEYIDMG